ncbi:MAG: thioredoxin family protein [Deltaproteobacteria bacterium]|nr:thioredoxin family protein [Deltaproteobacteria bacterium]
MNFALQGRVPAFGLFLWLLSAISSHAGESAVPAGVSGPVRRDHVTVELVADSAALSPGSQFEAGVKFTLDPEWHVYWKNPGDSGEAPRFEWELPPEVTAGALHWPAPERIPVGPLLNYGYEGEVVFPVEFALDSSAVPGETVRLVTEAKWLVCREDCIPGSARLELVIPVETAPRPGPHGPLFEAARATRPHSLPAGAAVVEDRSGMVTVVVRRNVLGGVDPGTLRLFPETEGILVNAAPQKVEAANEVVRVSVPKEAMHPSPVTVLPGLLAGKLPDGTRKAFSFEAVRSGGMDRAGPGLLLAILFAFMGGLLLNLMPCVFPVLTLKILGFVEQADSDPARVRRHGWVFASGVMAAFAVLAAALLLLRAGGEQLGWGFQLQSPGFVAALVMLLFALALSLSGLYEIGLSFTRLGSSAGGGYGGSFLTGVLATVVATPCTAPFMGPALGFALTQPAVSAVAVFAGLGAGMATPYVVLSEFPAWLEKLPRPGPWLDTFRRVMAFPLYGTGIWLLWVYGHLSGVDNAVRLLWALWLLAIAGWLWGRTQFQLRPLPVVAAMAFLAGAIGLAATARPPAVAVSGAPSADAFWKPWSPEAELAVSGKPLFVNYTAAWCITCQVNERTVFSRDDVRAAFGVAEATVLKADWTQKDSVIAGSLARLGRNSVPTYAWYPEGISGRVELLPPVLTASIVINAVQSPR